MCWRKNSLQGIIPLVECLWHQRNHHDDIRPKRSRHQWNPCSNALQTHATSDKKCWSGSSQGVKAVIALAYLYARFLSFVESLRTGPPGLGTKNFYRVTLIRPETQTILTPIYPDNKICYIVKNHPQLTQELLGTVSLSVSYNHDWD